MAAVALAVGLTALHRTHLYRKEGSRAPLTYFSLWILGECTAPELSFSLGNSIPLGGHIGHEQRGHALIADHDLL